MSRDKHTILGHDVGSLPEDGGGDYNRLIFEQSPYLLQHAKNPVDWHPWSDQALALAAEKNKPIFLSIGYSTCHWCHVMADESFASVEVATILNRAFIAIKVDREERPDIDATFMQACQAMTGSGGWPLTLILTPDLLPFFAATYLPKDDQRGMIGLINLLTKIENHWPDQQTRINATGEQVLDILKKSEQPPNSRQDPDSGIFRLAARQYRDQYDALYGGFGAAPKFPAPHNLSLLFRLALLLETPDLAKMATNSLRQIRNGGIYDQIGGGIHRYSVDERWLVPHFEKMLYDQTLLIGSCIDAYQYSGDNFYREMALDTADYILHNLSSPEGGFYCGEDADSEGSEGTYYLWDEGEVKALFSPDEYVEVKALFGIRADGNFEGQNIFHLPEGFDEKRVDLARSKLTLAREQRARPHLDDKIITSWNGLAISALARLGTVTEAPRLIDAAEQCARLIKKQLLTENGRLLRRWRHGEAAIPAFLEDYACLITGLIDLYQARFDNGFLSWALALADNMITLFSDKDGKFFDTGHDQVAILVRGRNIQDGAFPSGNGMAALALARLGQLSGRQNLLDQATRNITINRGWIEQHPSAFAYSIMALAALSGPSANLVLATEESIPNDMLKTIRSEYRPFLEIVLKRESQPEITDLAPITAGKRASGERPKAWLCSQNGCHEPVTTPEELKVLLDNN